MRDAPPVRAGGKCVVCGKQRHPERSRRYAGVQAELDPFCRMECARDWYGNPLPGRSIWADDPESEAVPA